MTHAGRGRHTQSLSCQSFLWALVSPRPGIAKSKCEFRWPARSFQARLQALRFVFTVRLSFQDVTKFHFVIYQCLTSIFHTLPCACLKKATTPGYFSHVKFFFHLLTFKLSPSAKLLPNHGSARINHRPSQTFQLSLPELRFTSSAFWSFQLSSKWCCWLSKSLPSSFPPNVGKLLSHLETVNHAGRVRHTQSLSC